MKTIVSAQCWVYICSVMIWLSWYTACDTLQDMIFAIHIFIISFTQELSVCGDWRNRIRGWIGYCMYCDQFVEIKRCQILMVLKAVCLFLELYCSVVFTYLYVVLKASSCVTFSVIFYLKNKYRVHQFRHLQYDKHIISSLDLMHQCIN